jgi:hypothetical protein
MSTPRDKAAKGMDRQEAMADRRQKQKEREEKWVETQIIGFTAWINSYIQKRGKKVVNLQTDFQDGLLLVDFLELASSSFRHHALYSQTLFHRFILPFRQS